MRKLLWSLAAAILIGLPAAWFTWEPIYTQRLAYEETLAWQEAGLPPIDELPAHFPPESENASARRLLAQVAALGIASGAPGAPARGTDVERERLAYLEERLAGRRPAAGAELQSFRQQHAAELETLVSQLADAEPPRWDVQLERGFDAPLPRMRVLRELSEVLAVEALERPALAERALRGLANLSAGLHDRPELVSQVMAMGLDSQTLRLARRLESVPAYLAVTLGTHDYDSTLWQSWQTEAWVLRNYAQKGGTLAGLSRDQPASEQPGLGERLRRPLERAFLRVCAADYARVLAGTAARGRALTPCTPPQPLTAVQFARWNMVGRMALPALDQLWTLLLSTRLEGELTRIVLALRAQGKREGGWPEQLHDADSLVCPGVRWRFAAGADGSVEVAWGGSEPRAHLAELTFTARRN